MGIKDLFITPVYIIIFTLLAYLIRPYVTNKHTRKYFLPALWVRFGGAIALGLVYQFYYGGGDTFNYYRQASVIYEALTNDFIVGVNLIFDPYGQSGQLFEYSSRIYWFHADSEYFLIRIIGFISLFTFNTYSVIAIFFATFSFVGSWLMFSLLNQRYDGMTRGLAYGVLFIPSCIFWGSGILKDTVTLAALGITFWSTYKIFNERKLPILFLSTFLISVWLIYSIKIYVLICFLPALFIWWYLNNIRKVKNAIARLLTMPFFLSVFGFGGYILLREISSSSQRYSLDSLAEWVYITSYDIRYFTGKDAGSGYDLGYQDGTWQGLIPLIPSAINVSLFRPYIWEVRNPLMLLSAIEALIFFFLFIKLLARLRFRDVREKLKDPLIITFILFSLTFAFAVGVSTYNFGTLSRYKIPLIPFYITALLVLLYKAKRYV